MDNSVAQATVPVKPFANTFTNFTVKVTIPHGGSVSFPTFTGLGWRTQIEQIKCLLVANGQPVLKDTSTRDLVLVQINDTENSQQVFNLQQIDILELDAIGQSLNFGLSGIPKVMEKQVRWDITFTHVQKNVTTGSLDAYITFSGVKID